MSGALEFIRSLGFGGMLGAGLIGLVYSLSPSLFSQVVNFQQLLIVGGLLGAGVHGLVNRVLVQSVLGPIAANTGYYSRLLQLLVLRRLGLITRRRADVLIEDLTQEHFLPLPSRSGETPVLLRDLVGRRKNRV
jgi:hypothetical protein